MKKPEKGGRKAPAGESRHGQIAEGQSRRLLQASAKQWRAWDLAAERHGLSFNAWARALLDGASRRELDDAELAGAVREEFNDVLREARDRARAKRRKG
jgi:hypothetical protein